MASASLEPVVVGRPRRHRAVALMLTSLGWMVCAVPAMSFAAGSWLGPLGVLVVGGALLTLCVRAEGDVPFAAVGVGTTLALAMGLATVAVAGGVPVALLAALAVLVLVAVPVASVLVVSRTGPPGRGPTLAAWALAAGLAALSFPGAGRIELAILELRPVAASTPHGPDLDHAPTALARAPVHAASVAPAAGPSVHATTRHVTAARHGVWIWLTGVLLVAAGAAAGLRSFRRLRMLRGARRARRTPSGYVLEDGEPILLEPPSHAPRVVVQAARSSGYRGTAVPRAQLLGEGELPAVVASVRRRSLAIALGTLVVATAAWLPVFVLG